MRAIVVGAGIGGLAAAIALRRAGVKATVFERAERLEEIGAGISLWANAMKALRRLGLYESVLETGRPMRPKGELRRWDGRVLYEMSASAMEERLGEPTVGIYRADLQKILLGALSEGVVRLDARSRASSRTRRAASLRASPGPPGRPPGRSGRTSS